MQNGDSHEDHTPAPVTPRDSDDATDWASRVARAERVLGASRVPRTDEAMRVLLVEQATMLERVEGLGRDVYVLDQRGLDLQQMGGAILLGVQSLRADNEMLAAADVVRDQQFGAILAELGRVTRSLCEVNARLGEPGDPDGASRLSLSDATPEQVAEYDRQRRRGTGLHGRVEDLAVASAAKDADHGAKLTTLSAAREGAAKGAGAVGGATAAVGLLWALVEAVGGPAAIARMARGLLGG